MRLLWAVDLDGTLVDSEPVWRAAERATVEERGGVWTEDLVPRLRGQGLIACGRVIAAHIGTSESPEAVGEALTMQFAARLGAVQAMDGAADLLRAVREIGDHVAVVTNSDAPQADLLLRNTGLWVHCERVRAQDGRCKAKPEPDLYREACADFGIDPRKVVAVEDSRPGALAAQRAGIFTIGVGMRPGDAAHVDLAVERLREIDVPRIRERVIALHG